MTPDDRAKIEAFAQRIADAHVCGATIRYDWCRFCSSRWSSARWLS